MIHVLFGGINRKTAPRQYIHDIDGYFDGYFEGYWMENKIAPRAVKEIDKSELIAPKIIESPVFNTISHEWLSGGTKQIILMYNEPNVIYDGDNFGDNCWPLFLEVGREKDIAINLSYYPIFKWVEDIPVHIINTDKIVKNFDEFNNAHLSCIEDSHTEFEFNKIKWPIKIDYTKFELEEIDF